MSTLTVTTQAELDAALLADADYIDIKSPAGVWLDVADTGSAVVRAYDSAAVRATGSAVVRAYDSATVTATGSATVAAYGSAVVRAYDSAAVRATGSATVAAYDWATVAAYGSAAVRAYDSATVAARPRVAVHLHSGRAHIAGGVLIDHTQEPTDPAAWCTWHEVTVTDGTATLYKAVDDQWTTSRGTDYSPGTLPTCDDWSDDSECGGGLHFSPSPMEASAYYPEATRFLAVGVAVDTLRPILGSTPKAKAPCVVTACREVDIDGREVTR